MTNKSEEVYSACIKMVIEIMPDFEPNFEVVILKMHQEMPFKSNFLVFILQDAYFIIDKLFGMSSQKRF